MNEQCKWCTVDENDDCKVGILDMFIDKSTLKIMFCNAKIDLIYNNQIIADFEINYCPMCGKRYESEDEK